MMRLLSLGGGPFRAMRLGNPFLGLDVDDVSEELAELMTSLPEDLLGRYQPKYDECRRQLDQGGVEGLIRGLRCMKNLYEEVKDALRQREATPLPARPPAAGGFPWIPVAIAGTLAAGAAVYFATRG